MDTTIFLRKKAWTAGKEVGTWTEGREVSMTSAFGFFEDGRLCETLFGFVSRLSSLPA